MFNRFFTINGLHFELPNYCGTKRRIIILISMKFFNRFSSIKLLLYLKIIIKLFYYFSTITMQWLQAHCRTNSLLEYFRFSKILEWWIGRNRFTLYCLELVPSTDKVLLTKYHNLLELGIIIKACAFTVRWWF